jgi:CRP-like cAMP-binding protein
MTGPARDVQPPQTDVAALHGGSPVSGDNLCRMFNDAIIDSQPDADPRKDFSEDNVVQARRTIWREGDNIAGVPVICQGWAATAMAMSDGRRQILSFLLPGDLVSAVLIFQPLSQCSVEAITDVRYRSFPRDELQRAIQRQPALFALVSRMWSDEAMRADRLAIDLGRRGAAERIASLILALRERMARRGTMQGATMDFPLRQHHIADAVGLTVVHVGNILTEFRRAGLLEITDRSLTIADPAGLRGLAAEMN